MTADAPTTVPQTLLTDLQATDNDGSAVDSDDLSGLGAHRSHPASDMAADERHPPILNAQAEARRSPSLSNRAEAQPIAI